MVKNKQKAALIGLIGSGLLFSGSTLAGIKCWTNSEGVRECGNAIPPEYAQQGSETLNERGLIIDRQERAKTRDELVEERRRAKEEAEQAHYDRVLLSTYLTEKEIIQSRDRKIASIDATIEVTRITIDKLEEDLQGEQKRAADYERKGREIPESLQHAIDSLERQIADKRSFIESKEREKEQLKEKYAQDIERFRELKESGRSLR